MPLTVDDLNNIIASRKAKGSFTLPARNAAYDWVGYNTIDIDLSKDKSIEDAIAQCQWRIDDLGNRKDALAYAIFIAAIISTVASTLFAAANVGINKTLNDEIKKNSTAIVNLPDEKLEKDLSISSFALSIATMAFPVLCGIVIYICKDCLTAKTIEKKAECEAAKLILLAFSSWKRNQTEYPENKLPIGYDNNTLRNHIAQIIHARDEKLNKAKEDRLKKQQQEDRKDEAISGAGGKPQIYNNASPLSSGHDSSRSENPKKPDEIKVVVENNAQANSR